MRIILVGFGTVGQSIARILDEDKDRLVKDHGLDPQVIAIADSQGSCRDEKGLELALALKSKEKYGTVARYPGGQRKNETSQIISTSEAEVMVETSSSNFKDGEPGLTHIKQALTTGKHVVTSNKGPLALAMPALLELAAHKNARLLFSGSVGAGTPFLSFASKCLPGEEILGIHGVLNGTTNYILTRMEDSSLSFRKALAEAQKKGYAEADPSNDIEGFDSAAKIVILANWILKRRLGLGDLDIAGISNVTTQQLSQARAKHSRIKLIGRVSESQASVKPENVKLDDPVCVPGTLNALTFSTKHAGNVSLIGSGAGGESTASAIIRDLVELRREYLV